MRADMEEYKRDCNTCNFRYLDLMEFPCSDCFCHSRWENPINDWLVEWLSSFDTNSVTECFEAVNILKMKIAQEEMHEADVPDTNVGEMEVHG